METVEIDTDAAGSGQRLDRFLADRLGLSRARVRHLLEVGCVCGGGRTLSLSDKSHAVALGERFVVEGTLRADEEQPTPNGDLPLTIVAEGEGWIVVDKPPGCGVHPLRSDQRDTVLNALVAVRPEILSVGEGGLRSGVVHRLDVDTSGGLVFATNDFVWRRLRGAFGGHQIEKRYRALVAGRFASERRVDLPLEITRHRPARVEVRESGRTTRQHVRSLRVFADATLVEVRLETGFLHQIRATLAHLGHPVLGDREYGDARDSTRDDGSDVPARQLLHARRLRFEEIDVEIEEPPDFAEWIARLEARDGR